MPAPLTTAIVTRMGPVDGNAVKVMDQELCRETSGRPSFGVTDSEEYDTLIDSREVNGAEVWHGTVEASTRMAPEENHDDDAPLAPNRVPRRDAKEPGQVTVLPESNTIDIPLTSQL